MPPTLSIQFDVSRTKVVLRAAEGYRADLARIAIRFPGAGRPGPLAVDMALDDFFAGIEELASWPDPGGVHWEQSLQALARDVLADSDEVERRIDSAPSTLSSALAEGAEGPLGADWAAPLTDFQQRDISMLLSMSHGANFSVPGAGKTRVGLALYAARRQQGKASRLLVIAPKAAYEAWLEETALCFRTPPVTEVMGRSPEPGAEILVVNYERLPGAQGQLAGWLAASPSMVVLDEAHRMKLGSAGAYGSACMALAPLARCRLILTGTPAPNGVQDLENLLAFVWPGDGRRRVRNAVDGGNLARASAVLRPLFARTTKSELGLPTYRSEVRYVDLPPLHSEIYDALVGRYSLRAAASREEIDAFGRSMLRLLMAATSPALLRGAGSRYEPLEYRVPPLDAPDDAPLVSLLESLPDFELSPKYAETLSIIAGNAGRGRKTLVWSTFVRSLTTMEHLFREYKPAIVHGGSQDREEQLRRFRDDPECMVLLSNPATLGEGISLHHHCNDAVYVDRDFAAGRFLQSLDRIHRLGLPPDAEVNVTVLAARGTVDAVVAERLQKKLEFLGAILDDPSVQELADLAEGPSIAGGMDMEDIRALLQHVRGAGAPVPG